MGARRASATAVAAVAGCVLLMSLLVAWAAAVGPSGVLTGEGPRPVRITPTESETTESADDRAGLDDVERTLQRRPGDNGLLRALALVLEILLAGVAAYLLLRGARWAWQTWDARRRPDPPPPDADFDVLGSPAALAEGLAAQAAAQRDALAGGGSPRNAVVEAWNRFEVAAEQVGAHRRPWETSSEYTLRVLEAVDADSAAVAALAGLYREARFSSHVLTEVHRAAALDALERIHRSLGVAPGRTPGGSR